MNEEIFCSQDLAKLLHEKGFDIRPCFKTYKYSKPKNYSAKEWLQEGTLSGYEEETTIPCPTLQLVLKVFRNKHGILINVVGYYEGIPPLMHTRYYYGILRKDKPYVEKRGFTSYEAAAERGIFEVLKDFNYNP